MKIFFIWLGVLLLLGVIGFGIYSYVVSRNEIVADDPSPIVQDSEDPVEEAVVTDPLEGMDEQTKQQYKEEVTKMQDQGNEVNEPMNAKNPTILSQAEFEARAHDVTGQALLINDQGILTLRFEDFETINGPDLHIYLSRDLKAKDYVDLGKIKATKGNVNYSIPRYTDVTKYHQVLVWCVPFGVLFSSADLNY